MKTKQISCAIFAIATVATAALMTTGCSKDEEYDMQTYDDEYTLAEPMMTRSTEGTYTPHNPRVIHHQEKNIAVECFGWIKGVQYKGTLTVDATIFRDTLTNNYTGAVDIIECSARCINPTATITGITEHSAIIYAGFEGTEGESAGISFRGNKSIQYW